MRCWPGRPPPRTTASACRGSWGRRRDDSRGSIAGSASDRGAESRGGRGVSTDLTRADVAELSRLLTAGDVRAAEVTRAHLDKIAADDDRLGAYLHVDADAALAAATAVDESRAGGAELGPVARGAGGPKGLLGTQGRPP